MASIVVRPKKPRSPSVKKWWFHGLYCCCASRISTWTIFYKFDRKYFRTIKFIQFFMHWNCNKNFSEFLAEIQYQRYQNISCKVYSFHPVALKLRSNVPAGCVNKNKIQNGLWLRQQDISSLCALSLRRIYDSAINVSFYDHWRNFHYFHFYKN